MEEKYTPEELLENLKDRIWFRSQCRLSIYRNERYGFLLKESLDEVSGWNRFILHYVQRDIRELRRAKGLLLTGPSGCGKHTAVTAAAMYLMNRDGWSRDYGEEGLWEKPFTVLYISASDLSAADTAPSEVLEYLLDDYLNGEDGSALCLILESPEEIPEYREFLEDLGCLLVSYRSNKNMNPLIFFLLSEKLDEDSIPFVLRCHVQVCRMLPPNAERREAFWRCAGEDETVQDWMDKRTPEDMARLTEGMTYRQLSDLVQSAYWALEADDAALADEHLEYEQRLSLPQTPVTDEREILYRKIGDLLEELPDLAERFIDAIGSISITTGGGLTEYASGQTKSGEKEAPADLKDIMGEQGKYVKEGVKLEDLTDGAALERVIDREKFEQDFSGKKLREVVPPLRKPTAEK